MVKTKDKFRLFFAVLAVVMLMVLFGVTAWGATIDSAYYMSFINADRDLYGEKYAPAQKPHPGW